MDDDVRSATWSQPALARILMAKFVFAFFLMVFAASSYGKDLLWPLPDHQVLTGGFADSRPDHFHGGVDVHTGPEKLPVVAPADGWIERIAVTPPGYGRTLYFRLPDGHTAVFAHLNRFAPPLETLLRDSQLVVGTSRVDLIYETPSPERQLKRGDLIAYSGDTGSGPAHFHFEMREDAVQIDPLAFFSVEDKTPPTISILQWIGLNEFYPTTGGHPLARKRSGEKIQDFGAIHSFEPIAIYVRATDESPWGRRSSPKVIRIKIDSATLFETYPSRVDLVKRDIYQKIVRTSAFKQGNDLRRLFETPPAAIYRGSKPAGWLSGLQNQSVTIEVEDRAGNISVAKLQVTCGAWPQVADPPFPVEIRRGDFMIESNRDAQLSWANIETDGEREISLTPANLDFGDRIVLRWLPTSLPHGAYFYQIVARGRAAVPSTMCDSTGISCRILHGGSYGIAIDSNPPQVSVSARQGKLRFSVGDGESGVDDGTLRCKIDGQTAIPEYETNKHGGFIWTQEPLTRGGHHIEFTAGDRAGNLRAWLFTVRVL
jgi:hypothetical protein